MSKITYRRAVDDIKPDAALLNRTVQKLRDYTPGTKRHFNRYFIASSVMIILLSIMIVSIFSSLKENASEPQQATLPDPHHHEFVGPAGDDERGAERRETGHLAENDGLDEVNNSSTIDLLFPHVADHYLPLTTNSESLSTKLIAPLFPLQYEDLREASDAIVLATLMDIGEYMRDDADHLLSVNLGTYIYAFQIDEVLSGRLDEGAGDFIPVAETAVAGSVETAEGGLEWRLRPYTNRIDASKILEKEKQYIVFISDKDDTEVYGLTYHGFGVFPVDYVESVALNHTLSELKQEYEEADGETFTPEKIDLLYRLCSLWLKNELGLQHNR